MIDHTERAELLRSVDRFATEVLAPATHNLDEAARFPSDIYRKFGQLGAFGLFVPEAYGGVGPDLVTSLLVTERLARESIAFAVTYSNCGDCIAPIVASDNEELKAELLPQVGSGEWVPSFCLSEVSAGSDVAGMKCRAERRGDHYILHGTKSWITSAPVADVFVVFAKTEPEAGSRGISAFVIPRATTGVSVASSESLLGLRSSPVAEVIFDSVAVPADHRLGAEGDGFHLAMSSLDDARLQIAAAALGGAHSAVHTALAYAKDRVQFGKSLIEHQGVGFLLADLTTGLTAARALLADATRFHFRTPSRRSGVRTGMAKLYCTDFAMQAASIAVQILGANGLSKRYPVERILRDCKVLQILEGANEIQRWLIARHLQRDSLPLEPFEDLFSQLQATTGPDSPPLQH